MISHGRLHCIKNELVGILAYSGQTKYLFALVLIYNQSIKIQSFMDRHLTLIFLDLVFLCQDNQKTK